ncbi:hypothetical protein HF670_11155 [Acidithiobacillus thiooxidans]|uniref:hypothetical protein n=1 Tax=Acidithiobacillus TaxID=119977 RepID=UPI001C0722D2|nr:hypothetical protein [Acidithiobacillus thiooxidans]MBU2840106.1 hypothetical protein [Acidithiobacillus thiooxidans]
MTSYRKPDRKTKLILYGIAALILFILVILFVGKVNGESRAKARFEHSEKQATQLTAMLRHATNPPWIRTACKAIHKDNAEDAAYAGKHNLSFIPGIPSRKCNEYK